MYGVLLFGGKVVVNHLGGGLVVGGDDAMIKMKAWPRIGVLVNQLRLDGFFLRLNARLGAHSGPAQTTPRRASLPSIGPIHYYQYDEQQYGTGRHLRIIGE